MRRVIKGLGFLIIGTVIVLASAILAVGLSAVMAGILIGWLVSFLVRSSIKRWITERRAKVR